MSDNADRTNPASPARLQRARLDGQVAKSQELAVAIQLVVGLAAGWFLFYLIGNQLHHTTQQLWQQELTSSRFTVGDLEATAMQWALILARGLLPFLGVVFVVGILSHLLQTGPIFTAQRVQPDVGQLSPTNWFRRLFSAQGAMRSGLGIPKLATCAGTGVAWLWVYRHAFFEAVALPFTDMITSLTNLVFQGSLLIAGILLVAAVVDLGIEWWTYVRRMQMTDQELRDEQRTQSVSDEVLTRRRQRHRDICHRVEWNQAERSTTESG